MLQPLAGEYIARAQEDIAVHAAKILCQDLMRGDPVVFKAGYSLDAAVLSAKDVFDLEPRQVARLRAELRAGDDWPIPATVTSVLPAMVANVLTDEGGFADLHAENAGKWVERDGTKWYTDPGALHDDDFPDDALYVLYGDGDGLTVLAPNCPSVEELERRVITNLGHDVTIDDHGLAVPPVEQEAPPAAEQPPARVAFDDLGTRVYDITDARTGQLLDVVEATDACDALSRHSLREGFAPYGEPLADGEHDDGSDLIRPHYDAAKDEATGVFTNYEIKATRHEGNVAFIGTAVTSADGFYVTCDQSIDENPVLTIHDDGADAFMGFTRGNRFVAVTPAFARRLAESLDYDLWNDPDVEQNLGDREEVEGFVDALRRAAGSEKRRHLQITYDVTGLTEEQIGKLEFEAAVQAEASSEWPDEGHPDVPVVNSTIIDL